MFRWLTSYGNYVISKIPVLIYRYLEFYLLDLKVDFIRR